MRYTLFVLLIAMAAAFGMQSCSSCTEKKDRGVVFDTISTPTKEDTTRVFDMTKEFMEKLKNGNVESALDMLCTDKNDSAKTLTPDLRAKYLQQFKKFPVLDYEIETSDFRSRDYATATYRYRFMDNPTDDPNYPIHMRLTIEVEKIRGKYYVLLHDHKYITR